MWEVACGNTFGATALSSYGGFWISFAIVLTPGGFNIVTALGGGTSAAFLDSFGFFLMGWFIFTFILLMCTLRSTVAFFLLFFTLDLAFLLLGIGYLTHSGGAPNTGCIRAGGAFVSYIYTRQHWQYLLTMQLGNHRCLLGLVQRLRRYLRQLQLLLRCSRCPLPLVRQGPRATQQGRQRRCPRCSVRLSSVYAGSVV